MFVRQVTRPSIGSGRSTEVYRVGRRNGRRVRRADQIMTDPYLRLHAVNVYVTDLARSLEFYLNTLGFHLAFDARVGSGLGGISNAALPQPGRGRGERRLPRRPR